MNSFRAFRRAREDRVESPHGMWKWYVVDPRIPPGPAQTRPSREMVTVERGVGGGSGGYMRGKAATVAASGEFEVLLPVTISGEFQ